MEFKKTVWQIELVYLLWSDPSFRYKYSDVDGQDGQNHTKQGNRGEFTDELHPQEHPDKHNQQQYCTIHSVVVVEVAIVTEWTKNSYRWYHIQLKYKNSNR